jgi:hypothetical protein
MSNDQEIGRHGEPAEKAWWQSKTIIGIAVMVLSQALRHFKVDLVDAELTDILTLALDTAGAGLAIYGRVNARKSLKITMPGGAFNPRADVRRAKPIGNRKSEIGNSSVEALLLVAAIFTVVGLAFCTWPSYPEKTVSAPDMCGGRPLSQWVQVVPVVDDRPFFARLLASLRATPGVALITTEQGTASLRVLSVQITGGAEF